MAGRGGYDDFRDFSSGYSSSSKPIPTEPPFKAYVGNLPNGVVQGDVERIFTQQSCRVKGIQIIKDRDTDRFKGFCYVEFEDESDLRKAINLNGRIQVEENILKVDVAENKRNDRGGFDRRGRGGPGGMGGYNRGRDTGRPPFGDDFGNAMFSRYNDRGPQGRPGGGFGNDNRGNRSNFGNYDRNDDSSSSRNWSRGPDRGGGGSSNYGGNRSRGGSERKFTNEPLQNEPIDTSGRKRLVLKPRTVQDPINALAESSKSSSIYGGAKPRDEKIEADTK